MKTPAKELSSKDKLIRLQKLAKEMETIRSIPLYSPNNVESKPNPKIITSPSSDPNFFTLKNHA